MTKVLYVEDNGVVNIYMLKIVTSRKGISTVLAATDGAQGVAMAAAEQPGIDPQRI